MKTIVKAVSVRQLALFGCALLAAGCALLPSDGSGGKRESKEDGVGETGARLVVDYLGDTDVTGFRFSIREIACTEGGSVADPFTQTLDISLLDMGATTLTTLDGEFAEGSHHIGRDFFVPLDAACYEIVGQPVDEAGQNSAMCIAARAPNVVVEENATTQVLLISQCNGEGEEPTGGGADMSIGLNHPPRVESVTIVSSDCAFECQPIEARALVVDVDGDPIRLDWSQASGAPLFQAPTVLDSELRIDEGPEGRSELTESVQIVANVFGELHLELFAYDLMADGQTIEDWILEHQGQDVDSHAQLRVPLLIQFLREPMCVDAGGDLQLLPDVEPVGRVEGCVFTLPEDYYCRADAAALDDFDLALTCPEGVFDASAIFELCAE